MRSGMLENGRNMKPHIPVLLNEAVSGLQVTPGKRFIDATTGGGGHAKEIEKLGGRVLGIDIDADTGAIQGNFRDIEEIAKKHGFDAVDGILFDLGVSSHQLDTPSRGFSFRFPDEPLDMRMNQQEGETVGDLVNHLREEALYEILAKFSEDERSRAIAHAIVRARPISTTGDLYHIVGKASAAKIFQALRIATNDEMEALKSGLAGAEKLIKPGGRLVVISFHSLEDRIVKQFMRGSGWKVLTKKPITPGDRELVENRRSRSAKLRISEKI